MVDIDAIIITLMMNEHQATSQVTLKSYCYNCTKLHETKSKRKRKKKVNEKKVDNFACLQQHRALAMDSPLSPSFHFPFPSFPFLPKLKPISPP